MVRVFPKMMMRINADGSHGDSLVILSLADNPSSIPRTFADPLVVAAGKPIQSHCECCGGHAKATDTKRTPVDRVVPFYRSSTMARSQAASFSALVLDTGAPVSKSTPLP